VLDAIGRTPLVRLRRVAADLPCPLYGKVEFFNPGGSVKDRVGRAVIERAEAEGLLVPGRSTIVEATAGNTGVGLAIAAAVKGYRCIFVLPDKMSREKIDLLRAYGAEVVIVRTDVPPDSPESYGGTAKRLLTEIPDAWHPDQFKNLTNPEIHYLTTGPEIWEQTEGRVTSFVAGIGTGGTISGVGRFLKEKNPQVRIVGADPEGSILSGGTPGSWKVEGIGEDYVPKTFNSQVVDDWVRISDAASFAAARGLARQEGLLVGGSAGTAVAAALRYGERLTREDFIVALLPDTGRNYLSKLYNDDWMREHGFAGGAGARETAGDLLRSLGRQELIALSPDATVAEAVALCAEHGVSQIPVLEEGRNVGLIAEVTLARILHGKRAGAADHSAWIRAAATRVREVMARPLPEVEERTALDEVYRLLLSSNTAVLVRRESDLIGLIARIDLVQFWSRAEESSS
jgi:cystathionine beta-synthase